VESDCSYGDVRLESGDASIVRDGRVEVCVNRVWGTVCDLQFSEDDAQVVCSQMNFERDGECVVIVHAIANGLDTL
jgi:deleted-in-malignant-brain-tumors protein 1